MKFTSRISRHKLLCVLLLWAMLFFAVTPLAALEVPSLTGRVNDTAAMLSRQTATDLSGFLEQFEKTDSTQIVVLTIPSLEGEVLEEFSLRVVETWKIGQKGLDNGALLLVVRDDRKLRIEVGYGLEGRLTDLVSGRIISREIVPRFREGRFDDGISAGVMAMVKAVRGEYVASDAKDSRGQGNDPAGLIFLMIFVLVSVLFFVGEYLLVFLYGVDFIGSIGPFRILIVGMIFTGASQLFSSYLYSSGRNDLCLYANLTGLFFTVILDLTLIPKYGIIGSAYATFFSYLSIFIVYISILKIKERFYFTDLFIIKKSDIKIKKVNEK